MTDVRRRPGLARLAGAAGLAAAGVLLVPAAAEAHSLDSSTVSVHLGEDGADATVTVALATLDAAVDADLGAAADVGTHADEVVAYLAEHVAATGADGTTWAESWSQPTVETVEGIESVSLDVVWDTAGADPSSFVLAYDAVVESDATHEAVVVLTDAAGDISAPGVLDATHGTLRIGEAAEVGVADMVHLGLEHVLSGADHLLFLVTLLLVAPAAAVAGGWRPRPGVRPSLRSVLGVVTAFTVGHSVTLLACALGWVTPPSTPVEVLIAVSVGVSAVHALRPLVRRGEQLIAGGFGLVHGLAFAGILTDLGLQGRTSVLALLAFNLGIELAQLLVVLLVFPSLYLASRTRSYAALRTAGAVVALVAASAWALDRLGVRADPFAGVEDAVVAHLWTVPVALAGVAVLAWAAGALVTVTGPLTPLPPEDPCPTPRCPTSSAPPPASATTPTRCRG
ncbi:hypothetical protein ASG49_04320 [Marmoricola sp. Leaf446]|uniref:HupE/UreJ family protein n=1 Tax=Marmoricola sp. Leaf446 TaxID=1736379 RepID=UPI0006FD1680|nr:HupE/UreJ family protein [Marmoricola sp. Leaf446]KQT94142.1 hypothetical protein ASG49_04320 [Marmoricola sp. Leaf446]